MGKKTVIDTLRHSALETSLVVAAATTGLAGCSPEPSSSPATTSSKSVQGTKETQRLGVEAYKGTQGSPDLVSALQKLAYDASKAVPFDDKLANEALVRAVDDYAHAAPDDKAEMRQNGISYYRKVVAGNKEGHTSSVVIINPHYRSLAVFNNIQYSGLEDPVLDMSKAQRAGAIAQDPSQHIEQTYAETAGILQQRNESSASQHIRDVITRTGDIAKLPQRYIDMLAGDTETMKAFSIGSGASADFSPAPILSNFVESYSAPVAIRRVGDELVARVQDMDTHTWTDAGKVSIAPKQAKGFGDRVNESRIPPKELGR